MVLWIVIGLIIWGEDAGAKGMYEIGGVEHPWEEVGALDFLEVGTDGTMHPLYFEPDRNVIPIVREHGGRIFVTNKWSGGFLGRGFEEWSRMIDGDAETVYWEGTYVWPGGDEYNFTYYFDLGGVLPIRRIRFYPRASHPWRAIPMFELAINDGDPSDRSEMGVPTVQRVVLERPKEIHGDAVRDVSFSLQPVRYVILEPAFSPGINHYWEIAEMEAYGEGYVLKASYLSMLIDMGDLTSWGKIQWRGGRDERAQVLIYTRTGLDDDPNMYWRRTGRDEQLSNTGPTGALLTRKEYDQLSPNEKGPITYDTDHWSFWSAPYDFDAGLTETGIVSPGPRRYVQIRIDFVSTWTDAAYLEGIAFDYSQPPVATDVVGEIWPDEVELGQRTRFVYALRPTLRVTDLGFDGVEVVTLAPADTVWSVRLGGEEIPFSATYLEDPARFVVRFPEHRVDASRTIKGVAIEFDVSVFRHSTEFTARVLDTSGDEVSQLVRPGNATARIPSDGISVRTPLEERTLGSISTDRRAVTPNGDGINDEVTISYDLFKLTHGAEVELTIYELSGKRICILHTGSAGSGRYRSTWDGKDEQGRPVAPGVYVCCVEVRTDQGVERRVSTVCVAY